MLIHVHQFGLSENRCGDYCKEQSYIREQHLRKETEVSSNADLMKALTAKPNNSRAKTVHQRGPMLGRNGKTPF